LDTAENFLEHYITEVLSKQFRNLLFADVAFSEGKSSSSDNFAHLPWQSLFHFVVNLHFFLLLLELVLLNSGLLFGF